MTKFDLANKQNVTSVDYHAAF